MSKDSISSLVIKRLPRYYRFLGDLDNLNFIRISSREKKKKMGLTASQIRQDLNCFGGFGQQGYGYNVKDLQMEIGKILGVNNRNKTILIGAGNLGKAIASHIDFTKRGCELIGIFDNNKEVCGQVVADLTVSNIDTLEKFCQDNSPMIAVLCIPKDSAQKLVEKLSKLNIKAFWNFSHYDLKLNNSDIIVENVHLGDSLMVLSYGVNTKYNK